MPKNPKQTQRGPTAHQRGKAEMKALLSAANRSPWVLLAGGNDLRLDKRWGSSAAEPTSFRIVNVRPWATKTAS